MKSSLPIGAIVGVIITVLAAAVALFFFVTRVPEPTKATADSAKGAPGMPADVQAEFAKRMGTGTATGPGGRK